MLKSGNERDNISEALDETLSRYVIKLLYLFVLFWLREQDLLKHQQYKKLFRFIKMIMPYLSKSLCFFTRFKTKFPPPIPTNKHSKKVYVWCVFKSRTRGVSLRNLRLNQQPRNHCLYLSCMRLFCENKIITRCIKLAICQLY